MKHTAVIGDPVQHSLSPRIHGYWLEKYGIDGTYSALAVPAGHLEAAMPMLKERFTGFNVTLPHKEAIVKFCDRVDPVAQVIGAVNTVVIRDGLVLGVNSDAFGFIENLRTQYPAFAPVARALVLGAGGAARAAVYALLEAGVSTVVVSNRNQDRAAALAREECYSGRVVVVPWEERARPLPEAGLIVNTTALGMAGQAALEIDLANARAGTPVYDIVYRPLMTGLLHQARARGLPVVTGLGMLLHQARPGFQAWFGVMPEVEDVLVETMERAAA